MTAAIDVRSSASEALKAPFPWFGGKAIAAPIVWEGLGKVDNYVEPFFGSGAVLLQRPHKPGIETVNDLDRYVANFWRAVQSDPDGVAQMRRVRVCCGDWSRVCGPTVTAKHGLTGVFLDPPYADTAKRVAGLYAEDDLSVAHAVREWAIAAGANPLMRICLAGYQGEHAMPPDWRAVRWKANGGYGSQSADGQGRANAVRETLWFSPHCVAARQPDLFVSEPESHQPEQIDLVGAP
jgi:hypothetical protein